MSLLIVWLVFSAFSTYVERSLSFSMLFEYTTLIRVILVVLLSSFFAGIYPAYHLSSFNPINLIRGVFNNYSGKRKSNFLRSTLVVIQYMVSIVALVATFTVFRQLNFIKNKNLGFEYENIINVSISDPAIYYNPEEVITKLKSNPQIIDVATSTNLPITIRSNIYTFWEGKDESDELNMYRAGIDNKFIDFYGINIIEGRSFSDDYGADTLNRFVINQKAAKELGWDNPIGKKMGFKEGENLTLVYGEVIGVIEDFHFQSLHLPVAPLALNSNKSNSQFSGAGYFSIKISSVKMTETLSFIDETFKTLSPNYRNSSSFLDERVDMMYSDDSKMASLLIFSTILAILLACMGLYGLSSYTTESRTKEIAVRKILGSHPSGIMGLLATQFAKWILISVIFAWPLAYLLLRKWLQNFTYHIDIGIIAFIFSLFGAIIVSAIAVGYHVLRASRTNPVELLRRA